MADKAQVETLDRFSREAMFYMFGLMDEMTGGAFKKGYRIATAAERIQEWDALGQEQMDMLVQSKGQEWLLKQGAEIEKLRRELEPK